MQPDTKYASADGARVAYQVFGVDAPTIVIMSGSFTHTDGEWEDPGAALFLTRLGSFARVVRYDHLGTSNSDPFPADWDPARGYAAELDGVLTQCGPAPVTLLATLDAGPAAINYAADHPERIGKLILINTLPRFLQGDGYPYGFTPDEAQGLLGLYDASWGDITPTLLQGNIPSKAGDARFAAWYAKLARMMGTPSAMGATLGRAMALEGRESLARLTQPTLIMHRTAFRWIPIEHGRYLAEHIANARFVELPGADGPFYYETPDLVLDSIRAFIEGGSAAPHVGRELLTVLRTDIVRSTERASAMGDRDWNAVLRVHNDLATAEVGRASGRLVKFTGDGMLATFADPARALDCALQLRANLARMDVPIRVGLHTGQVNVSADDVAGLAVHIAARVMAAGGDGGVVVSRTVHDLLLGSPFRFASLGSHSLKGIEGEWELFETLA